MSTGRFTAAVRDYLATCEKHKDVLSPKYHPAADSAVKFICHHGPEEADEIRDTFRTEHRAALTRVRTTT